MGRRGGGGVGFKRDQAVGWGRSKKTNSTGLGPGPSAPVLLGVCVCFFLCVWSKEEILMFCFFENVTET
jgi:hypothetical protein